MRNANHRQSTAVSGPDPGTRFHGYQVAARRQRMTAANELLPQVRRQLLASAQRLESLAIEWRPPVEIVSAQAPAARLAGLKGRVAIDPEAETALVDGRPVKLTANELAILRLLIARSGEHVSKPEIYGWLYGDAKTVDSKIIDVLICTLRGKLSAAMNGDACILNSEVRDI